MGNNIQGQYYSAVFTTGSVAGYDLIQAMETTLGRNIVAKKLTLISPTAITIDINNLGVYSTLFQDTDGNHKLSLDSFDCSVSSLKVQETATPNIFLAVIF